MAAVIKLLPYCFYLTIILFYSWHEMGYYDIPAKIDHILNHTKVKKIFLIGHSQGSTAFLVALSEKPQYNNKIEAAFSLAPIAYSAHMKSPIFKFIALFTSPLEVHFSL